MKNVKTQFVGLVAAIASVAAFAAEYEYKWTAADTGAAGSYSRLDGKIKYTVITENSTNCLKSMEVNIGAGSTLTFSGVDLRGAGTNSGFYFTNTTASTVIFNNTVNFNGHFRPYTLAPAADKAVTWEGWKNHGVDECFLGDTYDTVIKANADVKDWTMSTETVYVQSYVTNLTTHTSAQITNCYSRGNTFYLKQAKRQADGSIDFQYLTNPMTDDSGKAVTNWYSKAVCGRLYQNGANICAKTTAAYILYGENWTQLNNVTDVDDVLGTGLVRAGAASVYGYKVNALRTNTQIKNGGYGLNALKIVRAYPCSVVRFNGWASMPAGSHCASADVAIELMSGASGKCGSWFGTWPSAVSGRIGGVVKVMDAGTVQRGSSIMGGGGGQLWFENVTDDQNYTGGLSNLCKFTANAEVVVKGGEKFKQTLDIFHPCAFPTNGVLRIKRNGDVRLRVPYTLGDQHTASMAPTNAGIAGWMNYKYGESTHGLKPKVIVEKGGQLTQFQSYPFSVYDKITLDGGSLYLGAYQGEKSTDTGTYLYGGVTLKNGARIYPKYPQLKNRVGNIGQTSLFTVCGTSPSTNEVAFQIMGQMTTAATIQFDVWKTGDYDADFVCTAGLENYPANNGNYTNAYVKKTGNGRMLVKTGYKVPGTLELKDGVFAIEEGYDSDAYIIFNGGTLEVDSDTTISRLNAWSTGGTLKIASGAQVTINQVSGMSGTLNIEKPDFADGDILFTVRPTDGQLSKLLLNGCGGLGVDEKGRVYAKTYIGKGTKAQPFLITGLPSLKSFRDRVDGTNTCSSAQAIAFSGYYLKQTTDIDMSEDIDETTGERRNWISIGMSSPWRQFSGNYDGAGHKILNLKVVGGNVANSGFFGLVRPNVLTNAITAAGLAYLDAVWKDGEFDETYVGSDRYASHICNLTIECAEVSCSSPTDSHIGPLAARVDGAYIENCHVTKSLVNGSQFVGGLIGHIEGALVKDCSVDSDTAITTMDDEAANYNIVGGLIGGGGNLYSTNYVYGVINCRSAASIQGTSNQTKYAGAIGGLFGQSSGRGFIYASEFNGSIGVSGGVMAYAAGIAGRLFTSSVICCTNNSDIALMGRDVDGNVLNSSSLGGIVGYGCGDYIIGCVNNGSLYGDDNMLIVGGIFGRPHYDGNATRTDHQYVYIVDSHSSGMVDAATGGASYSQGVGYWSNLNPTFVGYEFTDAGEMMSLYSNTFYSETMYPSFVNCTVLDDSVDYELPYGKRVKFVYTEAGEYRLPAFDTRYFNPEKKTGYVSIFIYDPEVKLAVADVSAKTWELAPDIEMKQGGADGEDFEPVASGDGVAATLNFAGITEAQKGMIYVNGHKMTVTEAGDVVVPPPAAVKGTVILFY